MTYLGTYVYRYTKQGKLWHMSVQLDERQIFHWNLNPANTKRLAQTFERYETMIDVSPERAEEVFRTFAADMGFEVMDDYTDAEYFSDRSSRYTILD